MKQKYLEKPSYRLWLVTPCASIAKNRADWTMTPHLYHPQEAVLQSVSFATLW
jgi:hypothetical protein